MQAIVSFFTALFLMATSFFTALPHTFRLDSRTPERTVTSVEEVLSLYQEIAAKNKDIKLRSGSALFVGAVEQGMPGDPAAITANDLADARAEYYRDGMTLVLTLVPQLDEHPKEVIERIFGFPLDALLTTYMVEYGQAYASIVVDVKSGKIVAADYSFVIVTPISDTLQLVLETTFITKLP